MLKSAETVRETLDAGKSNPAEPVKTARSQRPGMAVILNSSFAVGFLEGQLEYFQQRGFDVRLLCPERRENEWRVSLPAGIPIVEVPMERELAPLQDSTTLARLWRTIRSLRPSVTNVGTPKAGLLGGLAAWLNRVPCRFYTLHGLRFETTRGLKRRVLILAERLACLLAHRVVCVSHSVREKAIAAGLAPKEKMIVFGAGSCNGIDAVRFAPHPKLIQRATALRRQLGIPEGATVLLFLGRLTRDKGIPELVTAFSRLKKRFPDLRLLLAGCLEAGDPLPAKTRRQMAMDPNIIFIGAVQDTPCYYAAADIVVLPSHREGLPTVVLEAQAAGKAVVGANATGIVDVVKDGETGLLFPIGNVAALAATIERLVTDKALARKLESSGQEHVRSEFQRERIWDALYHEYLTVLQKRDRTSPSPHKPRSKPFAASSSR